MGRGRPVKKFTDNKKKFSTRCKIKINFVPKAEPETFNFMFKVALATCGMEWGVAWFMWSRQPVRCIRWRRYGLCRYILVGLDRGRIVPMMRGFKKIRPVTPEERRKVEWWIERRKKYL